MRIALRLWLTLCTLAAVPGAAAAQVESHCVPAEFPAVLLPGPVTTPPPIESQEVSAPLVRAAAAARPQAGPDGQPDAATLDEMCKGPREAIRLAQASRFKEALDAGRPLLAQPREAFRDYTWDYLANAVGWSAVQTGDLRAAADAHGAAASRIDDPALADYHRAVMAALGQPQKSAAQLKDPAVFRDEIRKSLADHRQKNAQSASAALNNRYGETVLRHVRNAYRELRVLAAADPETARQEPLAAVRKAGQAVVTQVVPPLLTDGQRMQRRLDEVATAGYSGHGVTPADHDKWNGDVAALWHTVRQIKRYCRIHDYLVRMNLADAADSRQYYQQAHALLFVPSNAKLVWQQAGHARVVNGIEHIDLRLRVPYQETPITPWGVPFSGQLATPPGMKPLEPKMKPMQPMTGKMDPLAGKMDPMTGKPDPMTGQMDPMTGKMTPMAPFPK